MISQYNITDELSRYDNIIQDNTKQHKPNQDNTMWYNTRVYKTKNTRQYTICQDKIRQCKTTQYNTI